MSRDQIALLKKFFAISCCPTDEAMRFIKANGGARALIMSFYKNLDLGSDGLWDVWQLESPAMMVFPRPPACPHLGEHSRAAGLISRVAPASGRDAEHNTETNQRNHSDHNPAWRNVRQVSAIRKADNQNNEPH
jgi:hypothetical protein